MNHQPPALFRWILSAATHASRREDVLGDVDERFEDLMKQHGVIKARRWYAYQAIRSVVPMFGLAIKAESGLVWNGLRWWKRRTMRHPRMAMLHLLGLSTGITCAILLALFVYHEVSHDWFLQEGDAVYRVIGASEGASFRGLNLYARTPAPLAGVALEELSWVRSAARVRTVRALFRFEGGSPGVLRDGLFADPSFFRTLGYPGAPPESALEGPDKLVVTESFAGELGLDMQSVGTLVQLHLPGWERTYTLEVTAILPDMPGPTHLPFLYAVSMGTDPQLQQDGERWSNSNYSTYVRTENPVSDDISRPALSSLWIKYRWEGDRPENSTYGPVLQPVRSIHLNNRVEADTAAVSDPRIVWLLGVVACTLLFIACVNYVNLATASAVYRTREVGVRKAIGAARSQLVQQFILESTLHAALAFIVSMAAVYLLLPAFSALAGAEHVLSPPGPMSTLIALGVLFVLVVVSAGGYPAFVLASAPSALALKGATTSRVKNRLSVRSVLVGVQFAGCIAMGAGAVMVNRQLSFMENVQTGLDRSGISVLHIPDREARAQSATLVGSVASAEAVASTSRLPVSINSSTHIRVAGQESYVPTFNMAADAGFVPFFDLGLRSGSNFSDASTPNDVLINTKLAEKLGLEDAVGVQIELYGTERTIVGVLDDFSFQSLYRPVEALIINYMSAGNAYVFYRHPETGDQLMADAARLMPKYPLDSESLDALYAAQYASDIRMKETVQLFSIVALVLAFVGLLGTGAHQIAGRMREMGVRKALGAPTHRILSLFVWSSVRPMLYSGVLALPVTWLVLEQWMSGFAVRDASTIPVLMVVWAIVMGIGVLTTGMQSLSAARIRPAEALRMVQD